MEARERWRSKSHKKSERKLGGWERRERKGKSRGAESSWTEEKEVFN